MLLWLNAGVQMALHWSRNGAAVVFQRSLWCCRGAPTAHPGCLLQRKTRNKVTKNEQKYLGLLFLAVTFDVGFEKAWKI